MKINLNIKSHYIKTKIEIQHLKNKQKFIKYR